MFFLLLAFAIAPLFQGPQAGILLFIHICLSVVFIKLFLASYENLRIPYNSLAFSICAFYIWMALSISWSPAPSISLYMFVWLSIFPLCYFIYSLKQPNDWQFLPIGILSVTLIFAFIGIGQGLFLDIDPPISLFGTRNNYAAMINLVALPTTMYFISSKQPHDRSFILLAISLFILFFAHFNTGSRGAIIALLLGLLFIILINWKYIHRLSILIFIAILITSLFFANFVTDAFIMDRIVSLVAPDLSADSRWAKETISPNERLLAWKSAWEIIQTSPSIGTGIGTFSIIFPNVRSPALKDVGFFVHNDYLQFWLETGFIGLSLMVLIMVVLSVLFKRVLMHESLVLRDRIEISGLMAGLLTIAAHSFVDFNFYILAILMIMGFMCARIQEITIKYYPDLIRYFTPAHKLSRKIFILVSLVLPFVILSYSLPVSMADYYWRIARDQLEARKINEAELTLRKAASWNPENIAVRLDQYSLYKNMLNIVKSDYPIIERKKLFVNAILTLDKLEGINPLDGFVFESRGHLLMENADITVDDWEINAIEEFKKALQLHPRLYRARIGLARLLEKQGYLNEATEYMNDGIDFYYAVNLTGLEEYFHYAFRLNLMNGDTVRAREINQIEKDIFSRNK